MAPSLSPIAPPFGAAAGKTSAVRRVLSSPKGVVFVLLTTMLALAIFGSQRGERPGRCALVDVKAKTSATLARRPPPLQPCRRHGAQRHSARGGSTHAQCVGMRQAAQVARARMPCHARAHARGPCIAARSPAPPRVRVQPPPFGPAGKPAPSANTTHTAGATAAAVAANATAGGLRAGALPAPTITSTLDTAASTAGSAAAGTAAPGAALLPQAVAIMPLPPKPASRAINATVAQRVCGLATIGSTCLTTEQWLRCHEQLLLAEATTAAVLEIHQSGQQVEGLYGGTLPAGIATAPAPRPRPGPTAALKPPAK